MTGGAGAGEGVARGFLDGVRTSASCFSNTTASARRAARSLMPVPTMGDGDGKSGYCTLTLTGRLFPSTTFPCTTARKPFGPSIGVSSGSSNGVLDKAGETCDRRPRDAEEAFRDTGAVDDGEVPSPEYAELGEYVEAGDEDEDPLADLGAGTTTPRATTGDTTLRGC